MSSTVAFAADDDPRLTVGIRLKERTWCIAIAPDNKTILYGTNEGRVRSVDLKTKVDELVVDRGGRIDSCEGIAFHPDGRSFAAVFQPIESVFYAPAIGRYEYPSGKLLAIRGSRRPEHLLASTMQEVPFPFRRVRYSPSGKYLAADESKTARVLTPDDLSPVDVPKTEYDSQTRIDWTRDGRKVAFASERKLTVVDAEAKIIDWIWETSWERRIRDCGFMSDSRLVVLSADGALTLQRTANEATELKLAYPADDPPLSLVTARDRMVVATVHYRHLRVWDVTATKLIWERDLDRLGSGAAVAISPDGELIAAVRPSVILRAFQLKDGSEVK